MTRNDALGHLTTTPIVEQGDGSLLAYPSYGNPANQQVSYSRDGMPLTTDEFRRMFNEVPDGVVR